MSRQQGGVVEPELEEVLLRVVECQEWAEEEACLLVYRLDWLTILWLNK